MQNNTKLRLVGISIAALLLAACDQSPKQSAAGTAKKETFVAASTEGRWYSAEQVERGNAIFQAQCASCHKPDASGTPNWKEVDNKGKYPPPPLNGTAHAWHHSLSVLRRVVKKGGLPLGGTMPAFEGKLSAQQIDDALSFVQSHWSDEVYATWSKRNSN